MASAWDIGWGCLLLPGWMAAHHSPSHPHPIPTPPLVLIPLMPHCQHFLFSFLSSFPVSLSPGFCCSPLVVWLLPSLLTNPSIPAPVRRLPHQFSEEALLTFYSYSKRTMFSDLNLNFFFQKLYRGLFWAPTKHRVLTTQPNTSGTSGTQRSCL